MAPIKPAHIVVLEALARGVPVRIQGETYVMHNYRVGIISRRYDPVSDSHEGDFRLLNVPLNVFIQACENLRVSQIEELECL